MSDFSLSSNFKPSGDQPNAIQMLSQGILEHKQHQVLLGVTGSGKTFTMANVIQNINIPTLIISPNKILAAQLYAEFKQYFPSNAVEYFISYYDYYQPEAYMPQSDTYIEKDASINEQIDRLRLKSTVSLLERKDVIVVASVSCIYGLGPKSDYRDVCLSIQINACISMEDMIENLVAMQYERNNVKFARGLFRIRGDTIDIFPAYMETGIRVILCDDYVEKINEIDPISGMHLQNRTNILIYPAKHFIARQDDLDLILQDIESELQTQTQVFMKQNKLVEAQRLEQRTRYDLEMIKETGSCHGIENYSRHFSRKDPGERPYCLLDYFPNDFLLLIDESHVTIPQIRGMYAGDQARKKTLVNYGFRLPSALDNRPLKENEFFKLLKQAVYISATPNPFEISISEGNIVQQIIRPTGLIDPIVEIHPIQGQIPHLLKEIKICISHHERILIITLTKKLSEDLTQFLHQQNLKAHYLHSSIKSLQRIKIIKEFREAKFDILVGINLLREGLDLPEVRLVAILDADKEGFLRSETTLIQISGRASRNVNGKVIFYADQITKSMRNALDKMTGRREKQLSYNEKYHITPKTIKKEIQNLSEFDVQTKKEEKKIITQEILAKGNIQKMIEHVTKEMKLAADELDFESAMVYRDELEELKKIL